MLRQSLCFPLADGFSQLLVSAIVGLAVVNDIKTVELHSEISALTEDAVLDVHQRGRLGITTAKHLY